MNVISNRDDPAMLAFLTVRVRTPLAPNDLFELVVVVPAAGRGGRYYLSVDNNALAVSVGVARAVGAG